MKGGVALSKHARLGKDFAHREVRVLLRLDAPSIGQQPKHSLSGLSLGLHQAVRPPKEAVVPFHTLWGWWCKCEASHSFKAVGPAARSAARLRAYPAPPLQVDVLSGNNIQ